MPIKHKFVAVPNESTIKAEYWNDEHTITPSGGTIDFNSNLLKNVGNIIPAENLSKQLGATLFRWAKFYGKDLVLGSDGTITFADANLYRYGGNTLKTDANFIAQGYIKSNSEVAGYRLVANGKVVINEDQNLNNINRVECNLIPSLNENFDLGTSTNKWRYAYIKDAYITNVRASTVYIGSDVNLFRDGVNILVTRDNFFVRNPNNAAFHTGFPNEGTYHVGIILRKDGVKHAGLRWDGNTLEIMNASAHSENPDLWSGGIPVKIIGTLKIDGELQAPISSIISTFSTNWVSSTGANTLCQISFSINSTKKGMLSGGVWVSAGSSEAISRLDLLVDGTMEEGARRYLTIAALKQGFLQTSVVKLFSAGEHTIALRVYSNNTVTWKYRNINLLLVS